MKKTHIYALLAEDGEVRYVGKTVTKLVYRLWGHINDACVRKDDTYRSRWIRKCIRSGYRPRIILLESIRVNWAEAEAKWISYYRGMGARLTNHTNGGGEGIPGWHHTKSARKRIGEAARIRGMQAAIDAAKIANRGRKLTPAHLKALRASWGIGSKHSLASRRKMSISSMGKPGTRTGVKLSPEIRAKMSASAIGKPGTRTGVKLSAETKAKMSIAAYFREQRRLAYALLCA